MAESEEEPDLEDDAHQRQKIQIKPIASSRKRQVTFMKRKKGLMKKVPLHTAYARTHTPDARAGQPLRAACTRTTAAAPPWIGPRSRGACVTCAAEMRTHD